jgi:hypothetical protein
MSIAIRFPPVISANHTRDSSHHACYRPGNLASIHIWALGYTWLSRRSSLERCLSRRRWSLKRCGRLERRRSAQPARTRKSSHSRCHSGRSSIQSCQTARCRKPKITVVETGAKLRCFRPDAYTMPLSATASYVPSCHRKGRRNILSPTTFPQALFTHPLATSTMIFSFAG